MTKPILFEYFNAKAKNLSSLFELSKNQKASTNLGDNRENFFNDFLSIVLPLKLKVKSGEIIDSNNLKTGQLDTIIIRDDAPSLDFGGKNTYLAEGVFAVIEIKSNLTREKLLEAKNSFQKVEKLSIPSPTITAGGYNLGRPLRILFAYTGSNWETITKILDEEKCNNLFDLIAILDKGVFLTKDRLVYPYNLETGKKYSSDIILETSASALGYLYYYLVQYGSSFSTGTLQLEKYFIPMHHWGKD